MCTKNKAHPHGNFARSPTQVHSSTTLKFVQGESHQRNKVNNELSLCFQKKVKYLATPGYPWDFTGQPEMEQLS